MRLKLTVLVLACAVAAQPQMPAFAADTSSMPNTNQSWPDQIDLSPLRQHGFAADGNQKFVGDFVRAWGKVMNADRN